MPKENEPRPEMQPEGKVSGAEEQQIVRSKPTITPEQRKNARAVLEKTKKNTSVGLVGGARALDEGLRKDSPLSTEEKLILAEYFSFIADQIDPDSEGLSSGEEIKEALESIQEAKRVGIAQLLPQLRDAEKTAVELGLWLENGNFSGGRLPEGNTTLYLCGEPSDSFSRFVRRDIMTTNDRPTSSSRVAMMVVRAEDFVEEDTPIADQADKVFRRIKPFLGAAAANDIHTFVGIPVGESLADYAEYIESFSSSAAEAIIKDQNVLASTSLVGNQMAHRAPREDFGESKKLFISLAPAYAAESSRRQDARTAEDDRKSHYTMPGLVDPKADGFGLTHAVATSEDHKKLQKASLNFAEDVDGKLYRIGGSTLFPREGLEGLDPSDLVVRQQTAVKMTRNRIKAQLKQLLYMHQGMPAPDEEKLRQEISAYLGKLKDEHQILGFKITRCRVDPEDPKQYEVEIAFSWNTDVEEFVVRLYSDDVASSEATMD